VAFLKLKLKLKLSENLKPDLRQLAASSVQQVRSRLPAELRTASEPVVTLYQAVPDQAVLDQGFETDLLGLFEGASRLEADPHASDPPPRIILYLDNLWDLAEGDPEIFAEEVRTTYLHELGHFLGFDEDDLTLRNLD
jgi:predicted Zn-dependent protease with MMP-like domain